MLDTSEYTPLLSFALKYIVVFLLSDKVIVPTLFVVVKLAVVQLPFSPSFHSYWAIPAPTSSLAIEIYTFLFVQTSLVYAAPLALVSFAVITGDVNGKIVTVVVCGSLALPTAL